MVGVDMPDEAEALVLAERAERWVRPQVDAAIPGAADAIETLHAAGYRLFTASGEPSDDLHDYLGRMGVRERFQRLYGPDLIDTFKDGPAFYERIFADAGVAAEEALVVDDTPAAIGWAMEVGARAVLVGEDVSPINDALHVRRLRDLPELLGTD